MYHPYHPQNLVGDFFENKLIKLFDLVRLDSNRGINPDLASKDNSFFVEVKASSYLNGGVINKGQLYRFDRIVDTKRFYAFAYHSIIKNMQKDYPTKEKLEDVLDLKSLFIFPFSIIKSYFEHSKPQKHPKHDDFYQLKERFAKGIFNFDEIMWKYLDLDKKEYQGISLNENIHVMTNQGKFEQAFLNSFHPEFL